MEAMLLNVYQTLTDNLLSSGYSSRGAMPHAESLGSLEAKDWAADQWGGETESFRLSVPAPTSPQDDDTVEGQQHWDSRQVLLKWFTGLSTSELLTHTFVCLFMCQEKPRAAGLSSGWSAPHEMGSGKMEKGAFCGLRPVSSVEQLFIHCRASVLWLNREKT